MVKFNIILAIMLYTFSSVFAYFFVGNLMFKVDKKEAIIVFILLFIQWLSKARLSYLGVKK